MTEGPKAHDDKALHRKSHYEIIVIGAGVAGIYQIKRLADLGIDATVLDAAPDLGGTWYWNRYPGARFDSESYTYGYSFSKELLNEWHWKERFSGQPENLRYLNHVADKFDLRKYMQFNCKVEAAQFDETQNLWRLKIDDGRELTCRFVILAIGLLSTPTPPRLEGMDSFRGRSFHTYYWPHEPVEMAGKKVAIIGTGATAIQIIGEIADKVGELTVFQRRPNWAAPLNNGPISNEEMADIRPATTISSRHARARPAVSSMSPTGAASMKSRRRSGWRCGTSSTTSPASGSGSAISAKFLPTRRPMPSSPPTSPTASANA